MTTDEKLDKVLEVVLSLEARFDKLEARFDELEARFDKLEARVNSLEARVNSLEAAQLKTQSTLENTINKCIDVMYEGFLLNSSRFDNIDFDSVKRNSEVSAALAKMASDKVDRIAEKFDNIA